MNEAHGGVACRAVAPELERLLQRLRSRRRVRHVILGAVSLDGTWGWVDAAGDSRDGGVPMRPDTPWFLASITKLHIATVVLRLHERGLVDLDAPIASFLPADLAGELHVYEGVDYTHQITPTHLLGHLSGLPDCLDERPRGGRSLIEEIVEDGDRAWSFQEAVMRARDRLAPHFPPSDPKTPRPKIRYSDTNYQLLMVMAETVTGLPMSRLYRELLFEPLGLRHTWLPGDHPLEPAGEPATVWLGDWALEGRPLALASFGDLYGTIDDLLRFGRALFSGAVFDDPGTGEVMWGRFNRFGFPRGMASLRAPSWPIEYGLGMMRFELSRWLAGGLRLPSLRGHTGSTGSWLWYAPQLRLVIAGTVDQAAAASVPFRVVPRALAGLDG
ncbi:MAG: serine hydrolase domain-containing protein [Actinomycetota bacterium]